MKTTGVLFCALFLLGGYSGVSAQGVPPPGAGDRSLEDRNIKGRSVELERVKREARKPDKNQQPEKIPESKFQEIKEDFEQIQISQDNIITAYTKAKTIDFAKISENAERINTRGIRLKENLFPPVVKKDDKKSKESKTVEEIAPPQDVKTLIVAMDNTLATFTSNPIFTNPAVVNADSNAKAQTELERLIKLSAALKQEALRAKPKED